VRLAGRFVVALFSLVVLAAAIYGGVRAVEWLQSRDAFGLLSTMPERPARLTTIDPYTRKAAGTRWFADYFTTMVFAAGRGGSAVLTRWERPTVTIGLLDDPGPDVRAYLRQQVRRLDRLQGEVDFEVGEAHPLITVQFLDHPAYVAQNGSGSVGNTRTRYFEGSPGLIRARISIDAGVQDTPDEVKATLLHELTHAIGCSGHFLSPADRRRSVMYEANTLTSWSQNDAAVIRVLYSRYIQAGMTRISARAGLQRYAREAK
jgi:hypothetical protein